MSKQSSNNNKHDTKLSRSLSKVLRHRAKELGFTISTDGYIPVNALLSFDYFQRYNVSDIQRVVNDNDKQRFRLCHRIIIRKKILQDAKNAKNGKKVWEWRDYSFVPPDQEQQLETNTNNNDTNKALITEKVLCIRANQGHSIDGIHANELLTPISSDELANMDTIVHGTYKDAYIKSIRHTGLNRMNRNHIHFASGLPGQDGVISGMRKSCQIHVFLDNDKCAQDGIPFYKSDNGVVLTPGATEDGTLPVIYFDRVVDAKTKEVLYEKSASKKKRGHVQISE